MLDEASYVNRELSLLDFQERVMALAENPAVPLLEQAKFVAIVAQNLDEFFQVRVAGLKEQLHSGVIASGPDGLSPRDQLHAIREHVIRITEHLDRIYLKHLRMELRASDVAIVDWDSLTNEEQDRVRITFNREIFPVLTPLAFDPSHPFPYISNLSLNLAVVIRDRDSTDRQFARVKVPPIFPRFMEVEPDRRFVPLEQVIAANLDRLFTGLEVLDSYVFRVTRNADLAVEEEEAGDLLEAMESVLRLRQRFSAAVRLEVEAGISDEVLSLLVRELELEQADVYSAEGLLGLGALWPLHAMDRPDLKDAPWMPTTQARLDDTTDEPDMFEQIRRSDLLVHHPYESFATSIGAFLAQAAADPDVLAIKQTLYRTSMPEDPALGGEAVIVQSLIRAAQAGKQVAVLVELKARFDEEANINWARMLEAAGVHVVYGVPGLKTHSKILLVVRREGDGIRRYAHIGTGNYNPKTARIYEDIGIFTSDPDIGDDLSQLFNQLTGYSSGAEFRKLLVAPLFLRNRIIERIDEEAAKGRDGHIRIKVNHLVDRTTIEHLYAASNAGCRVELIVRGICCLRAGVPDLSDNIAVRSIVGRFLEHSRIYRFGSGSDAVHYIGSADLMPRNLDGRVEAVMPVTDVRLKSRLDEVLDVLLEDDELAWQLNSDGTWTKVPTAEGVNAHHRLQEIALSRTRGI